MFHPERQGFFPLLYTQLSSNMTSEEHETFGTLKSHSQRIQFMQKVIRDKKVSSSSSSSSSSPSSLFSFVKPLYGEKSSMASESKRASGNAAFEAGNLRHAHLLYSMAIVLAPNPSESLALALSNRSACLLRQRRFALAARDSHMALPMCPESKLFKLHERLAECLMHLGRVEEASCQLQEALGKLHLGVTGERRVSVERRIRLKLEALMKQPKRESVDHQGMERRKHFKAVICSIQEANWQTEQTVNIHPHISFQYEEKRGRFAVANKDIALGTTLVVERACVHTLHCERLGTHCQHCMSMVEAAVACHKCIWVVFCSEQCRADACNSYHQYECGILKCLVESGLNVYPFLALRCVTQEGLQKLLDLKPRLGVRDESSREDEHERFVALYSLMDHEQYLDQEKLMLNTMVACFLLDLLTNATHFFTHDIEDLSTRTWVGSLLLRLLLIAPCNCHDVSEFKSPSDPSHFPDSAMANKTSIGAAIYRRLALFNHSCAPDFMRCNFDGNKVVCVSNRPIFKGEEVCENYGLMFSVRSRNDRQRILRDHYHFECQCLACVQHWPLSSELRVMASKKNNLDKLDVSKSVIELLVKGEWDKGTALMTKWFEENPKSGINADIVDMQIAIWKALWLLVGNMRFLCKN